MRKEIIHLFERPFAGLGQDKPEEDCVCEIANTEDKIVLPASDVLDCDIRHLSNHGVERKRRHRRNRHTLRPGFSIKYFGTDDPGQRPDGCAEREVVAPGHYYKSPGCAVIVTFTRREFDE